MNSDFTDYGPFSDKSVRQGFIRKVYSILSVQVLLTFGVALMFTQVEALGHFAKENPFLFAFMPLIGMLVAIIPMACSQDLRRRVPHNFILLGIFTISEALALGAISSYNPVLALRAFFITAFIVVGLTIFAFQTKVDFTLANGFMYCVLLVFVAVGFILIFFPPGLAQTIYAAIGLLIFSVYLIIDTQMVTGGKHRFQVEPEDYIFAAITIYLDIIQIFLYVLQLLSDDN